MATIEELEKRIEELENQINAHSEILNLIGNVNTSRELKQYIERKLAAVNMINLVNSISNSNIPSKEIGDKIKYAQDELDGINKKIHDEISNANIPGVDMLNEYSSNSIETPLTFFKYRTMKNGQICIRKYEKDDYDYDDDIITVPLTISEKPVTCIGHEAFSGADMSEIFLPPTIEKIESRAFECCKNLKEFTIPSKVEILMQSVFWNCENLEILHLNNGLKTIQVGAITETNIKKLVIPSSVEYIDGFSISSLYRPIHILFEGKQIGFTSTYSCFNSPAIFYYKNDSIISYLEEYISNSDDNNCTINHNVDEFYSS